MVGRGLGVDGLGREVTSAVDQTLNVQDWLNAQREPVDCSSGHVVAHLVAEFTVCPTAPVPTLADPCDVTRSHDAYSRVVETAVVTLRLGRHRPERPYHRLRVLLGLEEVRDDDDEAGLEAVAARMLVLDADPDRRARELLRLFRVLAAADVTELEPAERPAPDPDDPHPDDTVFPAVERDAAVVLAAVDITVSETDGRVVVEQVDANRVLRTALLPTSTIQELACGLAPGLLDAAAGEAPKAPRVVADGWRWSADGRTWSLSVTRTLVSGSVRRAVRMTSLSERGWVDEDIDTVRYDPDDDPDGPRIVIALADRPVNPLVRIVVCGTGSTPVFGDDPALPLAGLTSDPPVPPDDGRDAVLTVENPLLDRRAEP